MPPNSDAYSDVLRGAFRGALLGTLLGDALGAPLEGHECEWIHVLLNGFPFLSRPEQETTTAIFGLITGGPVLPGSARYTDDTQMTIGVAQSLIHCGGFDGPDMARRFAENFDPARGYGMGAYSVLRTLKAGAAWDAPARALFGGTGSWGNGAAMRAAPMGLFFGNAAPGVLRQVSENQAAITHTHPLGKEGAVLQAAAVAVAARHKQNADTAFDAFDASAFLQAVRNLTGPLLAPFDTGLQSIEKLLQSEPDTCEAAAILGNGIEAHNSVPAALFSFLSRPHSFSDAVRCAASLGGDADTIAAMCGAVAGAFHGEIGLFAPDLAALENGQWGRDYVRDLADALFDAWVLAARTV